MRTSSPWFPHAKAFLEIKAAVRGVVDDDAVADLDVFVAEDAGVTESATFTRLLSAKSARS